MRGGDVGEPQKVALKARGTLVRMAGAKSRVKAYIRSGISGVLRNQKIQLRSRAIGSREYLDIGCGSNTHAGFINLNYSWSRGVNLCWDLARGLPLPDDSMQGVFTEHCLEHLPLELGDYVFQESLRVLKPGGTLRVVLPDGELYLNGYLRANAGEPVEVPFADRDVYSGVYTPIMSVNRIFNRFGHRFVYDFETLRTLLERHGAVDVERSSFGAGRDPMLLIDTERRAAESVYVEATKPSGTA